MAMLVAFFLGLVALSASQVEADDQGDNCFHSADKTKFPQFLLNRQCFILFKDVRDFNGAKNYCKILNGKLALASTDSIISHMRENMQPGLKYWVDVSEFVKNMMADSEHEDDNCVAIDSNGMFHLMRCREGSDGVNAAQLPFFCEQSYRRYK